MKQCFDLVYYQRNSIGCDESPNVLHQTPQTFFKKHRNRHFSTFKYWNLEQIEVKLPYYCKISPYYSNFEPQIRNRTIAKTVLFKTVLCKVYLYAKCHLQLHLCIVFTLYSKFLKHQINCFPE